MNWALSIFYRVVLFQLQQDGEGSNMLAQDGDDSDKEKFPGIGGILPIKGAASALKNLNSASTPSTGVLNLANPVAAVGSILPSNASIIGSLFKKPVSVNLQATTEQIHGSAEGADIAQAAAGGAPAEFHGAGEAGFSDLGGGGGISSAASSGASSQDILSSLPDLSGISSAGGISSNSSGSSHVARLNSSRSATRAVASEDFER